MALTPVRTKPTASTSLSIPTAKTPSTKDSTPIPRPRPDRPLPTDMGSLSREARGAAPDSPSPVNFGAWGNPTSAEPEKVGDTPNLGEQTLRRGGKGEEVKALQNLLNEKLGLNLDVDGVFGGKTLDAVRQFQESQNLKVDGLVGKDTKGALLENPNAHPGERTSPINPVADPQQSPPNGASEPPVAQDAQAQTAGSSPGATETVPGVSDTSWTENLPPGLRPHAQSFIEAGRKHNIDPRFLAAISMQETGGGRSSAIRTRNNAMGIMGRGGLRSFSSVGQSINSQAHSLTRAGGYYQGKHTISSIGGTYAPVGAKNDPRGLNSHWVPNVSRFFQQLGGDPSGRVSGF